MSLVADEAFCVTERDPGLSQAADELRRAAHVVSAGGSGYRSLDQEEPQRFDSQWCVSCRGVERMVLTGQASCRRRFGTRKTLPLPAS